MTRDISFQPLTMGTWSAFEKLFGPRGACGGCWCMTWRLHKKEYDRRKGDGNKNAIKALVNKNESLGVLAFHNDEAIGWCAIAPREKYIRLEKSRALKPVDDQPVWSVSCFFVTRQYRRKGYSTKLLKAAVNYAKEKGARLIEAYPIETTSKNTPDVFAWTGLVPTFAKAGFKEAKRHMPTRPIMRYRVK